MTKNYTQYDTADDEHDLDLRCDCCGGRMPPYHIWEARRDDDSAPCTGSIDPETGRCRAWVNDDLWAPAED